MFDNLIEALRSAGYFTLPVEQMTDGWQRLVVASKKRKSGGLEGNSFWGACIQGQWVVATWGGHYFKSPYEDDMEQLILNVFAQYPESTFSSIPVPLQQEGELLKYQLRTSMLCYGAEKEEAD